MEAMRENWTDDRLDHLNRRVEEGFARVDERFEQIDERFAQMDKRFDRMEDRFDRVADRSDQINERIFATQRIIIQVGGGMIATLAAGLLTVIATQL
jgi:archaellum component FlaC